jgi:hypothetical protein
VLLLVEHDTVLVSTRCWLWYEVVRCHDLSKGCYGMIPDVRMGLWIVWKGTLCTEWDSGQIRKVSEVWCGLERCLICEKSCLNQLRIDSRE